MTEPENSQREIKRFLDSQTEWLLQYKFGKSFSLKSTEIELEITNNKLLFGFLDDKGFQTWRVKKFEIKDEKLFLDLTRNFERENETVILIPRISAGELSASVELATNRKSRKNRRDYQRKQSENKTHARSTQQRKRSPRTNLF